MDLGDGGVVSTMEEFDFNFDCSSPTTRSRALSHEKFTGVVDETTVYENLSNDSSDIEEVSEHTSRTQTMKQTTTTRTATTPRQPPPPPLPLPPPQELPEKESSHSNNNNNFPVLSLHDSQHSDVSGLTTLLDQSGRYIKHNSSNSNTSSSILQEDRVGRLREELIVLKRNVLKEGQEFSKEEIVSCLDRIHEELGVENSITIMSLDSATTATSDNNNNNSDEDSSIAGSECTDDDLMKEKKKKRRRRRKKAKSPAPGEQQQQLRGRRAPRGDSKPRKKKFGVSPPRPKKGISPQRPNKKTAAGGRTRLSGGSSRRKRSSLKTFSERAERHSAPLLDTDPDEIRRILKGELIATLREEHSQSTRSTKSSTRSQGRTSALNPKPTRSARSPKRSSNKPSSEKKVGTSTTTDVSGQQLQLEDVEALTIQPRAASARFNRRTADDFDHVDGLSLFNDNNPNNTRPASARVRSRTADFDHMEGGLSLNNPTSRPRSATAHSSSQGALSTRNKFSEKVYTPAEKSTNSGRSSTSDFSGLLDDTADLKRSRAPRRKSAPMVGTDFDAILLIQKENEKEKERAALGYEDLNDVDDPTPSEEEAAAEPRVRGDFKKKKKKAPRRQSAPNIITPTTPAIEDITSFIYRSYLGDDMSNKTGGTMSSKSSKKKKSKKKSNNGNGSRRASMSNLNAVLGKEVDNRSPTRSFGGGADSDNNSSSRRKKRTSGGPRKPKNNHRRASMDYSPTTTSSKPSAISMENRRASMDYSPTSSKPAAITTMNRQSTFDDVVNRYKQEQREKDDDETKTTTKKGKKKQTRRASITDFTFVSNHSYVDPDLHEKEEQVPTPKMKTKKEKSRSSGSARRDRKAADASRKSSATDASRKSDDTFASSSIDSRVLVNKPNSFASSDMTNEDDDEIIIGDNSPVVVPLVKRSKIQQAKRSSTKFLSKLAADTASIMSSPRSSSISSSRRMMMMKKQQSKQQYAAL